MIQEYDKSVATLQRVIAEKEKMKLSSKENLQKNLFDKFYEKNDLSCHFHMAQIE